MDRGIPSREPAPWLAELGRGFRLVATGFADVTPFVERRVEFVVKLAYHATQTFREVSK
jgi:hypothetical protein